MMIHALRHMAIRLWLTVLIGSLVALAALPAVQAQVGLAWTFALAVPVFAATFYIIGWLFNRMGRRIVKRHVEEAEVWERAGKNSQAEKLLRKAVAVFDSFLISPVNRQQHARNLTGHMARFYLTQGKSSPEAEETIQAYLRMRPDDPSVAEAWLQRIERVGLIHKAHDDLIHRIGSAHADNPGIQSAIARHYMLSDRADFQALQTYRDIIRKNIALDKGFIIRLARLLFKNKRTDAWALQVYLAALQQDRKEQRFIKGVAACLHYASDADAHTAAFKKARALLSKVDDATLKKMIVDFRPPEQVPKEIPAPPKTNFLQSLKVKWLPAIRSMAVGLAAAPGMLVETWVTAYRRILSYRLIKPILKWTALALVGVGLATLIVNTATHLMQSRQAPEQVQAPAATVVTDPYTLQVAAYLKTEHAEKYVSELKGLGLDAYWTEAQGAKRKWYQVRLSHFADKASARAYGESLKAKGIIDDFYVANYQTP